MISLGIDTSNYTTSVALVKDDEILADKRIMLNVAGGEKGLRQSDALYQHWTNLPVLISEMFSEFNAEDIDIICVSTKPRPEEGSYMPVFNAGSAAAEMLASALKIPVYRTSHQEGHIMAAAHGKNVDFSKPVICAHLSGGTLELVLVKDGRITIVGGTKDISYGQLIDRTGVDLGLQFPCGKAIDKAAVSDSCEGVKNPFSRVFTDKSWVNLSGLETQLKKAISSGEEISEHLPAFVMERISESFVKISRNALKEYGAETMLVTGGVASSSYLRNYCRTHSCKFIFGDAGLTSDNACGPALMKGTVPWL